MKKYAALSLIFCLFVTHAFGHVAHYKKFKFLKYGLFLNDKMIGSHTFDFNTKNGLLHVISRGNFEVSKLGVVLMNYHTDSEEIYQNGKMIKYNSETFQNDKKKYVNLKLEKNKFYIDGSSFKGETTNDLMIGSWWNHSIIKNSKQISPISGRIIHQKVSFLGKKTILINKKKYNALHFHFVSDNDKPLNKKKLNMNVWYDSESLLWIKASYEKLGRWEYRLIEAR